jgi:hypothetical protein
VSCSVIVGLRAVQRHFEKGKKEVFFERHLTLLQENCCNTERDEKNCFIGSGPLCWHVKCTTMLERQKSLNRFFYGPIM